MPFVQTVTTPLRGADVSPVLQLPKTRTVPVVLDGLVLRAVPYTVNLPPSMNTVESAPGSSQMRKLFQHSSVPPCTSKNGCVRCGMKLPPASFCGQSAVLRPRQIASSTITVPPLTIRPECGTKFGVVVVKPFLGPMPSQVLKSTRPALISTTASVSCSPALSTGSFVILPIQFSPQERPP